MENKKIIYDFCPKCGALMKNGVCEACGHVKGQEDSAACLPRENPAAENTPPLSESGNHRPLLIAACTGMTVFIVLLCAALYMITADIKEGKTDLSAGLEAVLEKIGEGAKGKDEAAKEKNEPKGRDGDKKGGGSNADGYVPKASDDFYMEIADAVRDDLSYRIEWEECDVKSDQADASFYTVYPQLIGNIPHKEALNAYISQEALFYKDYCELYVQEMGYTSCHIESIGYVTYMDEDTVSLVFQESLALDSTGVPGLFDINIDLKTGTVREHDGMISYTEKLARRFRSQNEYQNGEKMSEKEWTDEQIRQLLEDSGGVVFFTPVGLEIGFNYNGAGNVFGWVTVTLKDYQEYIRKI